MQRYKASQGTGQNQAGLNTGQTTSQTQTQIDNTGNINTGPDPSTLTNVRQQATGEPEIEDMSLDNVETRIEEVSPPKAYVNDPSKTGFELRNFLERRKEIIDQTNRNIQALTQRANYLRRLAEVERLGGFDPARYNAKIQQSDALAAQAIQTRNEGTLAAKEAEKSIMYLQGMQGLQDLSNGSVNRAAAVWTEYSGMRVQINPRSDGKYDVLMNNKPYKTLSFAELSDELEQTFSQGYRDAKRQQVITTVSYTHLRAHET